MPDPDLRFSVLDLLEPTDLGADIDRRAALPEPAPEPIGSRRRVTAGVIAAVLFIAAAAFAWSALRPIEDRHPSRPFPTPAVPGPWSWANVGWTELPPPPEWRDGASLVWTGSELLYLGGYRAGTSPDARIPANTGFAFDPVSREWSKLPPAPVPIAFAQGLWTGSLALFFDAEVGAPPSSVLAWDPANSAWRTLARSPHAPDRGGAWAWTGKELVVAGGGDPGEPETNQAFALDVAQDHWRRLPDMPIGVNLADATWTGSEVVIVGSEMDRRNRATTRTGVAAAYEPERDAWRRLPDPPVSAQTAAVDNIAGRVLAWEGYSPAAAEYLHDEDRWRSVETRGIEGGECYADGVQVGERLFMWGCGRPAAFFSESGSWEGVEAPHAPLADIGLFSLGRTSSAGDVAVVEQVETVVEDGEPYLGAPDAARRLWVWRPPSSPPAILPPDADDAEGLVGAFMSEWQPGWETFLPTRASAEVLDATRNGSGTVPSFDGWAFRNWNLGRARATAGGYEVSVEALRDGEVIASLVFTIGSGITADGRTSQLVIIGVRSVN